jgi:hypothetical protein
MKNGAANSRPKRKEQVDFKMNSPARNGFTQRLGCGCDALVADFNSMIFWRRGVASTCCDEGVAATKGAG